jgi:hypothetical protein
MINVLLKKKKGNIYSYHSAWTLQRAPPQRILGPWSSRPRVGRAEPLRSNHPKIEVIEGSSASACVRAREIFDCWVFKMKGWERNVKFPSHASCPTLFWFSPSPKDVRHVLIPTPFDASIYDFFKTRSVQYFRKLHHHTRHSVIIWAFSAPL